LTSEQRQGSGAKLTEGKIERKRKEKVSVIAVVASNKKKKKRREQWCIFFVFMTFNDILFSGM